MSFILTIDGAAWRAGVHRRLASAHEATGHPLIPVVKGNGYGLGQRLLAETAGDLGLPSLAVGTVYEAEDVLTTGTSAEIIVLEPYCAADQAAARAWGRIWAQHGGSRLIAVAADPQGLSALAQTVLAQTGPAPSTLTSSTGTPVREILLEGRTSMQRFGMSPTAVQDALAMDVVQQAQSSGALRIRGLSLHLPLAADRSPGESGDSVPRNARYAGVDAWARMWAQIVAAAPGLGYGHALSLSHVSDDELRALARAHPSLTIQLRAGTSVWLTDRSVLSASGTGLAVDPIGRRTHLGYRQRGVPAHGTAVVVSGGTSHGIGLTAPSAGAQARQRVTTAGIGILDSLGRALSPFRWAGKQRWFIEPPHQHVSMIWLPRGCVIPPVGAQINANVRFTTSRFDAVLWTD